MTTAQSPKRPPVDLSEVVLHNTQWRGMKVAPKIDPAKFHQVSHSECLILDKAGKVWRTSNGLYRRTAADLPVRAQRVLASWGLFTAADIKAAERARLEQERRRAALHWGLTLQDAAGALGIELTKAQLKKLDAACAGNGGAP